MVNIRKIVGNIENCILVSHKKLLIDDKFNVSFHFLNYKSHDKNTHFHKNYILNVHIML